MNGIREEGSDDPVRELERRFVFADARSDYLEESLEQRNERVAVLEKENLELREQIKTANLDHISDKYIGNEVVGARSSMTARVKEEVDYGSDAMDSCATASPSSDIKPKRYSTSYVSKQNEIPILPKVSRSSEIRLQETAVTTNMFPLTIKPIPIYKYRIDLVKVTDKKEYDLTRGPRQDLPTLARRRVCYSLFYDLLKHKKIDSPKFAVVYDSVNFVYSKHPIVEGDMTLTMEDIKSDNTKNYLGRQCLLVKIGFISAGQFTMSVDTNDVLNCMETKQFLDVLTSAAFIRNGTHMVYKNKSYNRSTDESTEKPLCEAKVLKDGAEKSVRVVELREGFATPVVQIDAKKSPFWGEQPLMNAICEEFDRARPQDLARILSDRRNLTKLNNLLKDLWVETSHTSEPKIFAIYGMHKENAHTTKFQDKEGRTQSVAEYFRSHYDMNLAHPELPLIVERKTKSKSFHPIEILKVPRGQRVNTQKATPQMTEKMIRQCQMTPLTMMENMIAQKEDFDLDNNNKFFREFEVIIEEVALKTMGRREIAPAIKYQSNDVQPSRDGNLNWKLNRDNRFLKPANIAKWYIIIFDGIRKNDAESLASSLSRSGREHGLQLERPEIIPMSSEVEEDLMRLFVKAQRSGVQLVMAISQKPGPVHGALKNCEAKTGVVSQHLCRKTMAKAIGQQGGGAFMVLNNIALKMNPKCGGINHTLDLSKTMGQLCISDRNMKEKLFSRSANRMFVGLCLSHASPQGFADRALKMEPSEPTVVALTYSKTEPTQFGSEWWYQTPRLAAITDLDEKMCIALREYQAACNRLPDEIIIYRAGTSEGEFAKVQDELVKVTKSFSEVGKGHYKPTLTCIVVMTDSNYRLLPDRLTGQGRASDQNVKPGTVVDRSITNPSFSEFLLVPQIAIQGTSRPMRCTVVEWTQGHTGQLLKLEELEHLTNALCYAHQVCTMPTHIPGILYASENVAKRGREIWKHNNYGDSMASAGGGRLKNDGSPDFFKRLTAELATKAKDMYWA